jgi:hypothetical protein
MNYITSDVDISDQQRRQHIYIIGATGVGKSSLLLRMMHEDFSRGRGFALIDPHGDLARSVADMTPKDRTRDVIYFDPLAEKVIRYNPLIQTEPFHRATTAAHIVSAFKHIWANSWGARLEYILTNSLRLLLENGGTTLVELPRLLVDQPYRNKLLRNCDDPYIKAFWVGEYANYNDRLRTEAIAPIQNKVGQFANNPILRDIIGASSTIDIPDIMNTGKVLICDLSKRMGAEPSHLLGALFVTAFAQAAQGRHTIPEEQRADFTLYVDEFQNFATESFTSILSEARKYRLNLVLAHQYLSQLPDSLRDAVLGNAATKIIYRVGAQDAELLAAELGPRFVSSHLTGLSDYTARVKIKTNKGDQIAMEAPDFQGGSLKRVQNNTAARYARPRG